MFKIMSKLESRKTVVFHVYQVQVLLLQEGAAQHQNRLMIFEKSYLTYEECEMWVDVHGKYGKHYTIEKEFFVNKQ